MSQQAGPDPVEDRWNEIRAQIRRRWPQLSQSDLQMIDGDSRKLVALVHQKTGDNVSDIEQAIDEIAKRSEGLLARLTHRAQDLSGAARSQMADPLSQARDVLDEYARQSPVRATAIAFGAGLMLGVCIASLLEPPRRW